MVYPHLYCILLTHQKPEFDNKGYFMQNLKIGHNTQPSLGTGVTVFLFDKKVRGAYTLCGSAPASRELHTLDLEAATSYVDGLVFAGGSALGLGAAQGAVQWLREHNRGYPTTRGVIPIVPAAGLYDLAVKEVAVPLAEHAYLACQNAVANNTLQGRIGAGMGASVGKLILSARSMSGGLGWAELTLPNGVSVLAYAVVNSVGDVLDRDGNIIAGARLANGEFADCTQYLLSGRDDWQYKDSNTTLVAVFTNAAFAKDELKRISKMAVAGMARAISPAFTCYDGDLVFCFSLSNDYHSSEPVSEQIVGTMAAEAVSQAIVNAVKNSILL